MAPEGRSDSASSSSSSERDSTDGQRSAQSDKSPLRSPAGQRSPQRSRSKSAQLKSPQREVVSRSCGGSFRRRKRVETGNGALEGMYNYTALLSKSIVYVLVLSITDTVLLIVGVNSYPDKTTSRM